MHTLTRLRPWVLLAALACVAPAAHASEPLTRQAIGGDEGGTLTLRPKVPGIELTFSPGAGAPRRWTFSLLSPKGASSAEVDVTFPPQPLAPLVVILPRPSRDVPDGDLRLKVEASGGASDGSRRRYDGGSRRRYDGGKLDLVGLVGPWLESPRLRVLGDATVYAGTSYAPRVVVTVPLGSNVQCLVAPCERPLSGASLTGKLFALTPEKGDKSGKKKRTLIATVVATTDGSGSASLPLPIPQSAADELALDIAMTHADGVANASQALKVVSSARILVSTDKPLYQPGQAIHLRLLAKDRGTGHAAGNVAATFAVFDAKNNKVYQKKGKTSPEGVFATSMEVATLVNTGRWRITAKVGADEVERTVEVKPYVLPKFKVELTPERAAYRPGETVKGQITGRYFFGEPLRKAQVELVAETFDVAAHELVRVSLKLDDAGTTTFEFKLPEVLVGQPMLQGAATVQLTARVTDTAGQTQEGKKGLTIYKDALRVSALPEAGRLIAGVDNAIYFVVTTPDGAPAPRAKVVIDGNIGTAAATVETDASGVAEWHVTPVGPLALDVVIQTPDGVKARQQVTLAGDQTTGTKVLLRPSDLAPRAGDKLDFVVLVQGAVPHVFVDLIKDGQTLVTLSAPVRDGRATVSTTLAPELAGTVLAHAYVIGNDMDVYADTRPLVVRQAGELNITVVPPAKPFWAPGEDATLELKVTDAAGHPVLAALGLWAVDEAVFALSELQPGMEQVFFLLEQEIMRPKVEFHAFEPEQVFFRGPLGRSGTAPVDAKGQKLDQKPDDKRAARVLAAAAMPAFAHGALSDSRVAGKAASEALWRGVFDARAKRIANAVRTWVREEWRNPSGRELHRVARGAGIIADTTRDWFGVPFRLSVPASTDEYDDAALMSAGPDATWGTADDLSASLEVSEAMGPVWEMQDRREARRWGQGGVGAMMRPDDMIMMGGAVGFDRVQPSAMREEVRAARDDRGDAAPPVMVMRERPEPKPRDPDNKPPTSEPKAPDQQGQSQGEPPRIRSYFPETLYVNPLVMTDANGIAKVTFPMADSITTWRLSALASTQDGRLGSASAGLKVFQDFFVDIAFPASLTRKDEVTVPVAVYNYLPEAQTVELVLAAEGGLAMRGETKLSVKLGPNEVKGVQVPLVATKVGLGRLTVTARGSRLSDAVRREVKIEPDGFALTRTDSGMVSDALELAIDVPEGAIEAATTALLKLYPGMFAQVVDGLENMLQMPSGCFEQTSSTTFPNILVLRYLRDAKKSKPELEATALRYLQAGWQRLVTYEVPGGGFSWFGDAPANKVLTAYGLMEFEDMDKVYEIDRKVIARTRSWLVQQQQGDGSFRPDASHLHEESWGDMQKSSLLVSAYITWSLAHTRSDRNKLDAPLEAGLRYLKANLAQAEDAYVLGYIGNAFAEANADRGGDKATLRQVLAKLAALAVKDGNDLYFPTKLRTATYGSGLGAQIEVTALALRAFLRAGEHLDLIKPGLGWLAKNKDQLGNWSTTQATIQVLQAMIASLSAAAEPVSGGVEVTINGKPLMTARYTPDDFDVVRFIDASKELVPGKNKIRITPSAGMKPMFQLASTAYLPWGDARQPTQQAFDVKVSYDRTTLAKDDVVSVRVEVRSNLPGKAEMGIVDVAVPPGFEVLSEDLERAVADQTLQRFTLAGRQIILYVPVFQPDKPFVVTYRVRARFPVRAASGTAKAYEYYNPDNVGFAAPESIRVE